VSLQNSHVEVLTPSSSEYDLRVGGDRVFNRGNLGEIKSYEPGSDAT